MFSMRVEGTRAFAATLNTLSTRVRKSVLHEALEDGAEPIRALMARYAPHEPGPPDIRENMVISRMLRNLDASGGFVRNDEFQATVAVGPAKGFRYGIHQEYGTERHGAQPFARPAFDQGAPMAIPIISQSIWLQLAERQMHFQPGTLE